ncbi:metastasis-suppressor KiSS-1 [Paramisgurnus dabryanus]|uniref:metastasis-suppressor KiSS-1 n=1 Tax=Paramisgurnus dabryanus TaxID=90735 RepID=UPI0031F3799E
MKLFIILMLSVGIGDTYPSGRFQYYLKDEPTAALRDLRGTVVRSTAGHRSPKLSAHMYMGVSNPVLGTGPHQSKWWWSPERPYTKRRQNLAYYNLNSFGLRYGKREQNMLGEFNQKISVK